GPRQDRGERRDFGDRPRQDRGERRDFGDRPRQDRGERPYGRTDGPREHNASDLRSANREDRPRSPEIDEDVSGAELDRVTRAQLRTLESKNAEWVAKHLVMAGRLLDQDPELAFQHALAASRRGGRMAPVREAVGLTAYAAGHYGEALREFRTFRRISGSNEHLPIMADCERGLGRPDRALDLTRSEDAESLDTAGKVELAIVASGARADLQQFDAAVAALEIPQLDRNRAFSYSPRLFRAYADALDAAGRGDEAQQWRRQAAVAENALGVGDFAEPEIVDLVGEEPEPIGRPLQGSRTPEQDRADAGDVEPVDGGAAEPAKTSEASPSDAEPADADDAGSSNGEAAPVGGSPTDEPTEEMDAPAPIEAEDKDAPSTAHTPASRDDDR
ncbi:MAG: hypothetical protein ACQEXN_17240, partial [Actinomycetota bacterium]